LTQNDVRIRVSNRKAISLMLLNVAEVPSDKMDVAFALLDQLDKLTTDDFDVAAAKEGLSGEKLRTTVQGDDFAVAIGGDLSGSGFNEAIDAVGCAQWCEIDASIVRGLAYYTGMVFEVHEVGGKERAIAGGGRYDKLVELFGGPPTPACGFAMGDVVLSLVLQDKGLMPSGAELAQTLGARPDAFVISTGTEESETALLPLVAHLRRSGLHARHTSRTTRNIGKLLKEAASCHARFAVILDDSAQSATLKNLDTQEQQEDVALDKLAAIIKPTEQ